MKQEYMGRKRDLKEFSKSFYATDDEMIFMPKTHFAEQFLKWSKEYKINESAQQEFIKKIVEDTSRYTPQDNYYQMSDIIEKDDHPKQENLSAKKLNLFGGVFYAELKQYVSDPVTMMDQYNKEFRDYLDNANDIESSTDLYSLILQEAIKEKDISVITTVLQNIHDVGILLNLNKANENAVFYTIKNHDDKILDVLSDYIQKTNTDHNTWTLDKILSNYISNEFSFNIPYEEQDAYYQKLIVPLYGEVGNE